MREVLQCSELVELGVVVHLQVAHEECREVVTLRCCAMLIPSALLEGSEGFLLLDTGRAVLALTATFGELLLNY